MRRCCPACRRRRTGLFDRSSGRNRRSCETRLGAEPDRRVHRRWPRSEGLSPAPQAAPRGAGAPAAPRPDRPAAHAGRGRGVRRRQASDAYERWSSGCWRRRTTASAGRGTGSTWPAGPSRRATRATTSAPTPGATAITSWTASTRQALRPLRPRAAGRRRDAAVRRREPDRHRLPRRRPAEQQRGGQGAASATTSCGHRQRHGERLPRPDDAAAPSATTTSSTRSPPATTTASRASSSRASRATWRLQDRASCGPPTTPSAAGV